MRGSHIPWLCPAQLPVASDWQCPWQPASERASLPVAGWLSLPLTGSQAATASGATAGVARGATVPLVPQSLHGATVPHCHWQRPVAASGCLRLPPVSDSESMIECQ